MSRTLATAPQTPAVVRRLLLDSFRVRLAAEQLLFWLAMFAALALGAAHRVPQPVLHAAAATAAAALYIVTAIGLGRLRERGAPTYRLLVQAAITLLGLRYALAAAAFMLDRPRLATVSALLLILIPPILVAAIVSYLKHYRRPEGQWLGLDLTILMVSLLALGAPLVIFPLLARGGAAEAAVGLAWIGQISLCVGAAWAVSGFFRPLRHLSYTALFVLLGSAVGLTSVQVLLFLHNRPELPWWLILAYGGACPLVTVGGGLPTPQPGDLPERQGFATIRGAFPYVPAAGLVLASVGLTIRGDFDTEARSMVVGALVVSTLLLVRQLQQLNANRRLLLQRSTQALRDGLTGVLNRRAFDEDLSALVGRVLRGGEEFVLVLADLDKLKQINDGPGGHAAGDQALRLTANALGRSVRADDRIYRLGGDEFGVLLRNSDQQGGERVVRLAAARLRASGREVAFSSGMACCPGDADDETRLFSLADARLYRAKQSRREAAAKEPEARPVGSARHLVTPYRSGIPGRSFAPGDQPPPGAPAEGWVRSVGRAAPGT